MLVVTVEIWNGGNPARKVHVGSLCIINVSQLADVSDYEVYVDGDEIGEVKGHRRSDGAWALIRRAMRLKGAPR